MLLITVTRIAKGYRVLATSSHRVNYSCWTLYRNERLLAVISRSYQGEPCVAFDLREPLTPGEYQLRVECFAWPTVGSPSLETGPVTTAVDEASGYFAYYTTHQIVLMIAHSS